MVLGSVGSVFLNLIRRVLKSTDQKPTPGKFDGSIFNFIFMLMLMMYVKDSGTFCALYGMCTH